MYADHVYGRPVSGYPDAVKRITRDDLVDFHAAHYGPAEAILVVTGAVDPAAVAGLVEPISAIGSRSAACTPHRPVPSPWAPA
ncbi:MAG: insulinase family protein [Caldilineaceae bacterium]